MRGFDVNRFVNERGQDWSRLEESVLRIEGEGLAALTLAEARAFARLYRRVSSDLLRAQTALLNAAILDYLNDIVARSYAIVHASSPVKRHRLGEFFLRDFPRRFRREWRMVALAAAMLIAGIAVGAVSVALDPYALGALIPDDHQSVTPSERVHNDEQTSGTLQGDSAAAFSGWLFTHNIEVSFLVFALGLTFGLGTIAILFFNGVPLGALGAQYHLDHQALFFWAWVLPHGITELTVVSIAGGAGLILARGFWLPGRSSRGAAIAREARSAASLLLGAMPLLVLAGVIEATVSRTHAPALPYAIKLVFAGLIASSVYGFLLRAGRDRSTVDR
ncbi:MAG TPA: stage II sporulation protein M [Polyangiales bacterium]|jgi:uncharacterized membrane protein SpoIIM required for sporulation